MSVLCLLLLLPVCSCQANQFYGTVMNYYQKNTSADGSVMVKLRYQVTFQMCTDVKWQCLTGDCGNESAVVNSVVDSVHGWCQTEGVSTRRVPSNAAFQLQFNARAWVPNQNAVVASRAVTLVDLGTRSDTGTANASPQTTVLPSLSLPSNCVGQFSLLAFDPDGDTVQCRFGNTSLSECDPCTPPPVLTLSSSCTFSVLPRQTTNVSQIYAVQIVMEDFPRQNIILSHADGSLTSLTTHHRISKIPVQFLLSVDPPAPSCVMGLYIPQFLPPTPDNGAQLYVPVNQTLEIHVAAEANVSTISDLLVSAPYNAVQNTSGPGRFALTWTPSQTEDGESFPICFVATAFSNSSLYQSEFRCVIVTVGNSPAVTLNISPAAATISPTSATISPASATISPAAKETSSSTGSTRFTPSSPFVSSSSPRTSPVSSDISASPPSLTKGTATTSAAPAPTPSTSAPSASSSAHYIVGLSVKFTADISLSGIDPASVIQKVQQVMVKLGLPQNISVRVTSLVQQ